MHAVLLNVVRPFRGHVGVREDGRDRTLGLAGAAVDALVRVDVILVLAFIDAVHRTHLDAACVLGADARFSDHIWHIRKPSPALYGKTFRYSSMIV
jgi:hypothetical protein